ncbi:MAG: hypothetical protein LBK00_04540 [Treponema sp.]|jgi:hypothetical protein|nr:hypothetical protein [Treponema sp.]
MAKTLFDCKAYWDDPWVQDLDGDEERLYHFYLTSPCLDKSGVYKQTERSVEFYVRGLGLERIREITAKFTEAKKVIRCKEWIIVPDSLKNQNYGGNTKIAISVIEYLKKIPDEVFEALRGCDYPLDLSAIRPPKKTNTENSCQSSATDGLSIGHTWPTDEYNLTEFNLNSTQSNADAEKLSSHFIKLWQSTPEVFNFLSAIKRPKEWIAFWASSTLTIADIDVRVANFIAGVKSGEIQRRYVPSSPDAFALNGWFVRCAEPYKKKNSRIANDIIDDPSQYFTEVEYEQGQ